MQAVMGSRSGLFLDRVNAHVKMKAEKMRHATAPLLSWEEVASICLYTGPAYVPLNNFLREVGDEGAGPNWRKKLPHMHQLSYSSTVGFLISGLRKLVRVNDEAKTTVYRGFRGVFVVDSDAKRRKNSVFDTLAPNGGRH
jgi:hypothetical protein